MARRFRRMKNATIDDAYRRSSTWYTARRGEMMHSGSLVRAGRL